VQAEPGMIAFTIARAKRILLISFALPVTRENLQRLDAERSAVIRREGAMDMIVDFSGACGRHSDSADARACFRALAGARLPANLRRTAR
jgi:hypothetical protein